jgi:hypothetical protein
MEESDNQIIIMNKHSKKSSPYPPVGDTVMAREVKRLDNRKMTHRCKGLCQSVVISYEL